MRRLRLSQCQREALFALHEGWRWGSDGRTERGLLIRGWIVLEPHPTLDLSLPALTPAGAAIAREVWMAAPIEDKVSFREGKKDWIGSPCLPHETKRI